MPILSTPWLNSFSLFLLRNTHCSPFVPCAVRALKKLVDLRSKACFPVTRFPQRNDARRLPFSRALSRPSNNYTRRGSGDVAFEEFMKHLRNEIWHRFTLGRHYRRTVITNLWFWKKISVYLANLKYA